MSFFGAIGHLIGDVAKPIEKGISGFASGGILGGLSGFASGVASDFTGNKPKVQTPAPNFNLPVPVGGSGGGNVSLPFVGTTHIPGPVGTALQGAQQDLSNFTGIPINSGAVPTHAQGASESRVQRGVKFHTTVRAIRPGDVVVRLNGVAYGVSKELARHLIDPATGKRAWRPTPKPAISAHDMKVAKEYKRVAKKLAKYERDLGYKQEKTGTRRRSTRKGTSDAIIIKEA